MKQMLEMAPRKLNENVEMHLYASIKFECVCFSVKVCGMSKVNSFRSCVYFFGDVVHVIFRRH